MMQAGVTSSLHVRPDERLPYDRHPSENCGVTSQAPSPPEKDLPEATLRERAYGDHRFNKGQGGRPAAPFGMCLDHSRPQTTSFVGNISIYCLRLTRTLLSTGLDLAREL